jgi:membrane protein YdbS with pleckstrin-like domain
MKRPPEVTGRDARPQVTLSTGAILSIFWLASALSVAVVLTLLLVSSSAEEARRLQYHRAIGVLLLVDLVGGVIMNFIALRVEFRDEELVVERGLRPFAKKVVVPYQRITRVRANDYPVQVKVDLDDGTEVKLANDYTWTRGPLPEVEFKEGASSRPMLRMRRIAALVEERAEQSRRQQQQPDPG